MDSSIFSKILYILFRKQMFNKYQGSKTRDIYPSSISGSPFSQLERLSFNRVIEKLNSENAFLSKNVRELICENLTLKNKLYYAWDSTYMTKQNGKNDVAEQWGRLNAGPKSVSPTGRREPQRSPLWKKKQQQNCKEEGNALLQRQYSPGADSNFKRETIIEELSESHFQSKSETPKEKDAKRGLFLSKKLQMTEKIPEKMVKSVDHQRQTSKLQPQEKRQKEISDIKEKEQSETEKIVVPDEQPKEQNPEKSRLAEEQKVRHKKDNSPYLQAFDSRIQAESRFSKGVATPYKKGGPYESPSESRKQKYTNVAYLTTTAR